MKYSPSIKVESVRRSEASVTKLQLVYCFALMVTCLRP